MATDTMSDLESDDEDDLKIVLNVGGTRHETKVETLMRRPGTRLSSLAKRHRDRTAHVGERSGGGGGEKNEVVVGTKRKEYFFDRHPGVFTSIIDYYRSGRLIHPVRVGRDFVCFCKTMQFNSICFVQIDAYSLA